MLNRLNTLLQRIEQLRYTIDNSKGSQKMGAEIALKSDIQKLNRFGSHHNIVKVVITYTPGISQDWDIREIYYTDVTEMEALEYTRLKLKDDAYLKAHTLEAFSIPVGKPIKL